MNDISPVIKDQHTAARAYFGSVFGLLILEALFTLPEYLLGILHRGQTIVKGPTSHTKIRVILHRITLLQLPPIPFLQGYDTPDIIRFTVLIALNIIFGVNRIKFSTDYKLYGWLTIANGGLTLLSAARTNLISYLLAVPSNVLLKYHRAFGRLTLIHATLHAALTIQHYVKVGGIDQIIANGYIQAGLAAWIALILLFLTSLPVIRRRYFEAFYYPHFLFLAFVIGALVHAIPSKEFLLPGLALWGVDIGIRTYYEFRRVQVVSVEEFEDNVVKFQVQGVRARRPGQMAWIQIPNVSLSWHPFTLASSNESMGATIAIRGLGGFTRKLQGVTQGTGLTSGTSSASQMQEDTDQSVELSSMEPGGHVKLPNDIKMRVAGPYGIGSLEWDQYPVICLVAGGIGITPGISIASHIVHRASFLQGRATRNCWNIYLIWSVKDIRHLRWFEEELIQLSGMATASANRVSLIVDIHVSTRAVKDSTAETEANIGLKSHTYKGPGSIHRGRPNLRSWFKGIRSKHIGLDAAVNVCGPKHLNRDTARAAAESSDAGGLFYVEKEVFTR